MRIVENSFYEHDEHGLVKVVSVNNGVVSFEKRDESVYTGGMSIPAGSQQAAAGFRDCVEPADITVPANAAVFDLTGVDQ